MDVRHPDSFNELAPLGFVNIPHFQLRHFTKEGESVDTLPRDEPIYLIDTFGYYSTQSAKALDKSNYREVYVVDGVYSVAHSIHKTLSNPILQEV